MTQPANSSLAAEKEQLLAQVKAAFDFLPDDPDMAENLEPWLFWQLREFMQTLRRSDLELTVLMGLVGLLGPSFASRLAETGPGSGVEESVPVLRIV